MAKLEERIATHRERLEKAEALLAHREAMKKDALYRKLSRALTSLSAADAEFDEQYNRHIDGSDTAIGSIAQLMKELRAPRAEEKKP